MNAIWVLKSCHTFGVRSLYDDLVFIIILPLSGLQIFIWYFQLEANETFALLSINQELLPPVTDQNKRCPVIRINVSRIFG
jgi:hypothetical protein